MKIGPASWRSSAPAPTHPIPTVALELFLQKRDLLESGYDITIEECEKYVEHYLDEITFIGDFLGKKYEKFDKMSNEVGDEVIKRGVVLLKAFLAESDISEN